MWQNGAGVCPLIKPDPACDGLTPRMVLAQSFGVASVHVPREPGAP